MLRGFQPRSISREPSQICEKARFPARYQGMTSVVPIVQRRFAFRQWKSALAILLSRLGRPRERDIQPRGQNYVVLLFPQRRIGYINIAD
jgi:hypothetical protein